MCRPTSCPRHDSALPQVSPCPGASPMLPPTPPSPSTPPPAASPATSRTTRTTAPTRWSPLPWPASPTSTSPVPPWCVLLCTTVVRSHAKSSCTRLRKHHVLCLSRFFPHDCRTSCQVGMELENQDMRCGLYVVCCPTPSPVAHPRQRVCLLLCVLHAALRPLCVCAAGPGPTGSSD